MAVFDLCAGGIRHAHAGGTRRRTRTRAQPELVPKNQALVSPTKPLDEITGESIVVATRTVTQQRKGQMPRILHERPPSNSGTPVQRLVRALRVFATHADPQPSAGNTACTSTPLRCRSPSSAVT